MIRIAALRAKLQSDQGISMAELLIYSLLLGGVLVLVGSLLINSLRTQSTVTTVTEATTAGQLVARSVEQGIRNSSTFKLTTVNTSDQVLIARVSEADGAWTCKAWYYSNANDAIRFTEQATTINSSLWTPTELQNWTLLADGVTPAAGAAANAGIFSTAGTKVSLSFRVDAGDNAPATISSSAASRLTEGSTQCFT